MSREDLESLEAQITSRESEEDNIDSSVISVRLISTEKSTVYPGNQQQVSSIALAITRSAYRNCTHASDATPPDVTFRTLGLDHPANESGCDLVGVFWRQPSKGGKEQ